MSIATEVERLQRAKEDLKSAITEKGGTIRAGAKIDTYGNAVRSLPLGGDISKFGILNEVAGTNVVTCDYVNENEHNVEVKLSSDTVTDFSGREVKCIGKNFLDMNIINKDFGLGTPISFPHTVPANNMFVWTEPHIYVTKGQTYYTGYAIDGVFGNQTHYVNYGKASSSGCTKIDNGVFVAQETGWIALRLDVTNGGLDGSVEHTVDKLYFGLVPTDIYQPYTEKTYTANADGTVNGVTSISPTMNIICDGVDISAKYYCCPNVEYDRFMDAFQQFGNRTSYDYFFCHKGWNDDTYKLKYSLGNATGFRYAYWGAGMTVVDEDFSNMKDARSMFEACNIKRIVCIDLKNVTTLIDKMCYRMVATHTIEKIISYPTVVWSNNVFQNSTLLENVIFEGVIPNSISLQWCSKLTVESAKSAIRCLANLIDTNPFANTITFHADVWAKLDAEGNTSPNGNAWKDYINDIGWDWN